MGKAPKKNIVIKPSANQQTNLDNLYVLLSQAQGQATRLQRTLDQAYEIIEVYFTSNSYWHQCI